MADVDCSQTGVEAFQAAGPESSEQAEGSTYPVFGLNSSTVQHSAPAAVIEPGASNPSHNFDRECSPDSSPSDDDGEPATGSIRLDVEADSSLLRPAAGR